MGSGAVPAAGRASAVARILAAAGVAAAGAAALWSFRVPFPAWEIGLEAGAGRVVAAAAVGAALSGARAVSAGAANPLREARWFAAAVGAAAGTAIGAKLLPGASGLVAGAVGAALADGAVRWVGGGARRGTNLALAALLVLLFAVSIPAALAAATEVPGLGGVAQWVLGDVSGYGLEAGLAALGLVAVALAWAVYGVRRDGVAPRSAEWVLVGLAVGLGGLVAFVGAAGPAIARRCGLGPTGIVLGAGVVGAALLVLVDATGRLLFGGHAPPLDVTLGFVAIPAWLVANRRRLRAGPAGAARPAFEWLEVALIAALALGLGALLSAISRFVLAAT